MKYYVINNVERREIFQRGRAVLNHVDCHAGGAMA